MCTWELRTFWCESRELRADGKRTLCCFHGREVDLAGTAYEGADWVHRAYTGLMLSGSIGLIVHWC